MLADAPAVFDSSLVARLKAAGFLILGRTNTPEFGLNISTEPSAYGPTRNPWQLDLSAGRSVLVQVGKRNFLRVRGT